jgi:GTP-binding protein HflX
MQEGALFATLDPTTRQLILPDSPPVLVTDTVGFIQKLPTLLIDAFYATLESVYEADFFIHVVDVSSPHWLVHIQTTQSVVQANGHPVFYVFNKSDQLDQPPVDMPYTPKCVMSAHSAADIDRLKEELTVFVSQFEHIIVVPVPHTRSDIRNLLYKHGRVIADVTRETHSDITVSIQPILGEKIKGQLR